MERIILSIKSNYPDLLDPMAKNIYKYEKKKINARPDWLKPLVDQNECWTFKLKAENLYGLSSS